jgi:hypothetical protein
MNFLKALFGRCAEDVQYYERMGYPQALCIDDPDALQIAMQVAFERHNLVNTDLFISPPYNEFECPGYIVLKDEDIAADMQREVLSAGYECTRVKASIVQPRPQFF